MPITRATLRTAVRYRANMENSTFVSDTELNTFLDESAAELHGLLATSFEDYHLLSTTVTVAVGANTITLPTDFLKLRKLEYQISTAVGDWIAVPRRSLQDAHRDSADYLYRGVRARGYLLRSGTIWLVPESAADGTYRLWYTQSYQALASDSATLDDLEGWHEYAILDAAIKCLLKEEADAGPLLMLKQELKQRIQNEAASRDAGPPAHVLDTWLDEDMSLGRYPRGYYP